MVNRPFGILGILLLLIELYRYLRKYWLKQLLNQKKSDKRLPKPAVLRPKSERDCRFCRKKKSKSSGPQGATPDSWQLRKGGPKKQVETDGYFCPNKSCEYYGITDAAIHVFVGYGVHGKQEAIRDIN